MSRSTFVTPFAWSRYSRKLGAKIEKPLSAGYFSEEEAAAKNMRLVSGSAGSREESCLLTFYLLVDKDDGIIADAKYQLLGPSALIGAAEAATELVIGKNYDQAKRISADLIEQQLSDKQTPDLPAECFSYLNLIIDALEQAAAQCFDIPLAVGYSAPPVPLMALEGGEGYPDWLELPLAQKTELVEQVLDHDVRPYIALDGGGVSLVRLASDLQVIIAYQGACTSCFSSTGATLSYIQQVLQAKLHPDMTVIPDFAI